MLALSVAGHTQNTASRLISYQPAPGQHINLEQLGTPQAALQMTENIQTLVSLGNFGGNIILGFNMPCVNDPKNPYGIDFTILGNAFSGSSEPGVVWVMKDENRNGLPDDSWFEIAGSHYFHSKTIRNYEVTYCKTDTRDVCWNDNHGNSGVLKANSYNTQEYYPAVEFFPGYPQDSIRFTGSLLYPEIDNSNPMEIKLLPPEFGYADNFARKQGVELTLPDNPYSAEVEGAGGNPIDISWAVDSLGNYVELDSIHFIKIVTGYFTDLGRLGEASTDVAWVVDVEANASVSGKENLLVIFPHPKKILAGDSLILEPCFFRKGRKTESTFGFTSSNPQVATVNANGLVEASTIGESVIRVDASGETQSVAFQVVVPDSIEILSGFSAVYPGDSIWLEAKVYDNLGDVLDIQAEFANLNPEAGEIVSSGNLFCFIAKKPGLVTLKCSVLGFETEKQIQFQILSADDLIDVYFTLKTETENLFPLQWIKTGLTDLNTLVENRQAEYSASVPHSLAHAIVSGLQKSGVGFKLRDDENAAGKLYLYSVENDGEYTYGWGGKTSPVAFAGAWIVRLNGKQYLNGFDKIEIADGDSISLYHVGNITREWIFSRMLTSADSVKSGDTVEIKVEQTNCTFLSDSITETGFIPSINREITGSQTYLTNTSGVASVTLGTEFPAVWKSGNDAVLISEKVTTGNREVHRQEFRVYPNPVENQLNVSGENLAGSKIVIYTLNGQPVVETIAETNHASLHVQHIKTGVYLLKIIRNGQVEMYKLIKK